eukprot:142428-Chlamydomonas_euryale.AAC.6
MTAHMAVASCRGRPVNSPLARCSTGGAASGLLAARLLATDRPRPPCSSPLPLPRSLSLSPVAPPRWTPRAELLAPVPS